MVRLLADALESLINEFAHDHPQACCLDVGCGGQPLRSRLEQLGLRYTSLDVEQNSEGSVEHLGAIDRELPTTLANQTFDLLICTEVLEHVANWQTAFANLAGLLKPGGRLLVTCPHIWLPHEEPHDFFRPTNWALDHYSNSVGLTTLTLQRLGDGYDVFGTVLASVRVAAPKNQPWMWLLAGPLSLVRKLTLAVLGWRFMRRVLVLRTPLYLSVVAVFEKPTK